MEFSFSSDQEMLRDSFAKFLANECSSSKIKEWIKEKKGFSTSLWKKMGQLGWLGLIYIEELDTFLPAWWSRSNPVDLVAGLKPDHLGRSLECLLRCSTLDGILLLGIMPALPLEPLAPSAAPEVVEERLQALLEAIREVFDEFMRLADQYQKPVIIASELPFSVENLEDRMALMLGQMGCVCYPSPEDAAIVMASLAGYAEYLRSQTG